MSIDRAALAFAGLGMLRKADCRFLSAAGFRVIEEKVGTRWMTYGVRGA